MSIEGFRSLNSNDIETIINKSEAVKKVKREKEDLTPKEKKELSEEEKEIKSRRKQIQEKLIKFATRIPVFMYLTDYREETLKDVITQLEPSLFKKVTGLSVSDFELLVSLGVFNDALMNDAVYKFRRYEDSSLTYAGINKHEGERVGLFDTSLSEFDYLAQAQEESMITPQGLDKRSVSKGENAAKPKDKSNSKRANKDKTDYDTDNEISDLSSSPSFKTNEDGTYTSVFDETDGDWVIDALDALGIDYIDKRKNDGSLWVIDENRKLVSKIGEMQNRGASFKYSPHGGKATMHKASWWLKGYPVQKEIAQPRISDAEIASLEEGMTVFHKAFGYGEIVALGDTSVEVAFDDDSGKTRKFMFPSAFYQGLLQIG